VKADPRFQPIVNPHYRTSWDGPVLIIDDFLLNIDEFRESLMTHGNFASHRSNKSIVDVGPAHDWRQILRSSEFPETFNAEVASLQRLDSPTQNYGTNLFYSDMKIETRKLRSSHFPHTDYVAGEGHLPVVFNLWLHDGGGGTGFYTYDDHYTSSAMTPTLRYFAENDGGDRRSSGAVVTYQNYFHGNEEWKLWKVAEMKKNRAFVYCGDFWHRVLIPDGEFVFPNPRFSFVCFSTAPSARFLEESGSLRYLEAREPGL
jgi:hypothetical protein